MDALTPDVRSFLKEEMKIESSKQFLAALPDQVAMQYKRWQEANVNKPADALTLQEEEVPKSVVNIWRQEVMKTLRERSTTITQNKEATTTTTPTKTSASRMKALPMASRKLQQQQQEPKQQSPKPKSSSAAAPAMKKFTVTDSPVMESAASLLLEEPPERLVLVENPLDNDVLSGRGGLTNQHVGNEWYRRLVRCSRGFYRNCPKHTKLLVAKSIVHAVHNQSPPGRFLELHDKKKSVWKETEYRKAVEKSSQALRERWSSSEDDEILQRSMTVMFNKKLQVNSSGRATRTSVEEAVYFAVMSVALEYARRWGTTGVATLTEQLRPIVKSAGTNAIPRPNGKVLKAPSKPSLTTISSPISNPAAKAFGESAATATATQSQSSSQPPTNMKMHQAMQNAIRHRQLQEQQMHQAAQLQRINANMQMVAHQTMAPQVRQQSALSHNFVDAAAFATAPQRGPEMSQQLVAPPPFYRTSSGEVPTSLPIRRISSGAASAGVDTFGSPAPAKVAAVVSSKREVPKEHPPVPRQPASRSPTAPKKSASPRSIYHPPPVAAKVTHKGKNGDTFGESINGAILDRMPTTATPDHAIRHPQVTPSPQATSDNGFNTGAKRKLGEGATEEDIPEEADKRPKNHGMSPFHREILKMNLQSLVDW